MSKTFVEANIYKFTHRKDVFLKRNICFRNGDIVKILNFDSEGSKKFSSVSVYEVSIESKTEKGEVIKNDFKDVGMSKEVTLVKDFVYKNAGSLFELVTTV